MITANYYKQFVRQIKKAPKNIRSQVVERIELFVSDPFSPILNNHALTGEYKNYRSINITGDWRAIYQVLDSNTVIFIDLGTHSQLYK